MQVVTLAGCGQTPRLGGERFHRWVQGTGCKASSPPPGPFTLVPGSNGTVVPRSGRNGDE